MIYSNQGFLIALFFFALISWLWIIKNFSDLSCQKMISGDWSYGFDKILK